MASSSKSRNISLADAVNYMLESDDSDIDSSQGGLSSDEEEKLDDILLGFGSDYDERYVFLCDAFGFECCYRSTAKYL